MIKEYCKDMEFRCKYFFIFRLVMFRKYIIKYEESGLKFKQVKLKQIVIYYKFFSCINLFGQFVIIFYCFSYFFFGC